MTDYGEMRSRLMMRKHEISDRQKEIVGEQARLQSEAHNLSLELDGITQMLDGLKVFDPRVASPVDEAASASVKRPSSTQHRPPSAQHPNSLADKVRQILERSSKPLFPTQIRDELLAAGHTGKNLLVMVHTAIDRMGERVDSTTVAGRPAYRLKQAGKGSGAAHLVARGNGHANGHAVAN